MSGRKCMIIFAAVIILLILSLIPWVGEMESVPVSKLDEYPELENAYAEFCEECPSDHIVPHTVFYVVPVSNLWGRWERYILLCHSVDTPDVPAEGAVQFQANMHILSPWSEENIFTDLCRLKVRDYYLRMEPGEGVIVNGDVEFTHSQITPVSYLGETAYIFEDEALICDELLTTSMKAPVVSNLLSQEPVHTATTTFYFEYTLRMLGKRLCAVGYPVSSDHHVNAE